MEISKDEHDLAKILCVFSHPTITKVFHGVDYRFFAAWLESDNRPGFCRALNRWEQFPISFSAAMLRAIVHFYPQAIIHYLDYCAAFARLLDLYSFAFHVVWPPFGM